MPCGTMASSEVPRVLCTFDFLETLVEDILVVLFFEYSNTSDLPLQRYGGLATSTLSRENESHEEEYEWRKKVALPVCGRMVHIIGE